MFFWKRKVLSKTKTIELLEHKDLAIEKFQIKVVSEKYF